MILRRPGLPFAFTIVTVTAAVTWSLTFASIWLPIDDRALPVIRTTAAVSAVAIMFLLGLKWLGSWLMNRLVDALQAKGIAYLLDMLLTQRAQTVDRQAPTTPFPRVVR